MDDAVHKATSPGELAALVPHLLGFRPAESMVCLAFGNAPVARVDLPTSESDIPAFVSAWPRSTARSAGHRWRWWHSARTPTVPCRPSDRSSTDSARAGSSDLCCGCKGNEYTELQHGHSRTRRP